MGTRAPRSPPQKDPGIFCVGSKNGELGEMGRWLGVQLDRRLDRRVSPSQSQVEYQPTSR
jgi:hypothetical protein